MGWLNAKQDLLYEGDITYIICMKKIFWIFLLLYGGHAAAQVQRDSVRVYYKTGKSELISDFRENGIALERFVGRLRAVLSDARYQRFRFRVRSFASLEGPLELNERLYEARTASFLDYLYNKAGIRLPGEVNVEQAGCYNWEELERRVASSTMPYRAEVLELLREAPEWSYDERGYRVEYRKRELMRLAGGQPFRYMQEHFFPEMRYSSILLTSEYAEPEATFPPDTVYVENRDTLYVERRDTLFLEQPLKPSHLYLAVKTNLLYDALAVPNIGVDLYLGKRWSLAANWMYAWWKSDRRHRYWRTYGGDIEGRYWLGRKAKEKPLQGHHIGLYAQLVTYDFEWGGRDYLGDKWSYGGGISYGYSHPIARRLNLDFTLGIGYLGGEYKEYLPIDNCYVWQVTKQRHWFGPTKAEISLVWLIGRDNTNRKGGKR